MRKLAVASFLVLGGLVTGCVGSSSATVHTVTREASSDVGPIGDVAGSGGGIIIVHHGPGGPGNPCGVTCLPAPPTLE